jgi:hypothetical protein
MLLTVLACLCVEGLTFDFTELPQWPTFWITPARELQRGDWKTIRAVSDLPIEKLLTFTKYVTW